MTKAMRDTPTEAIADAMIEAGVGEFNKTLSSEAQWQPCKVVSRIYTAMQAARSEIPVQDDDAEKALIDIRKLAMEDHWGTPKVCWEIVQRIDAVLGNQSLDR